MFDRLKSLPTRDLVSLGLLGAVSASSVLGCSRPDLVTAGTRTAITTPKATSTPSVEMTITPEPVFLNPKLEVAVTKAEFLEGRYPFQFRETDNLRTKLLQLQQDGELVFTDHLPLESYSEIFYRVRVNPNQLITGLGAKFAMSLAFWSLKPDDQLASFAGYYAARSSFALDLQPLVNQRYDRTTFESAHRQLLEMANHNAGRVFSQNRCGYLQRIQAVEPGYQSAFAAGCP